MRPCIVTGLWTILESAALMDLLEYQGKQLFARHGVPVPCRRARHDRREAVAAADEIGYPCVSRRRC